MEYTTENKSGDSRYQLVGCVAMRNPDGSFCPSMPLYRDTSEDFAELEDDEIDSLPWDELVKFFDQKYKEYLEVSGK